MQWKIINSVLNEKRDNCVIMATGESITVDRGYFDGYTPKPIGLLLYLVGKADF